MFKPTVEWETIDILEEIHAKVYVNQHRVEMSKSDWDKIKARLVNYKTISDTTKKFKLPTGRNSVDKEPR
jgi:hypothetical protein